MKGNLIYWVRESRETLRSLKLTVCGENDTDILNSQGLAELRRIKMQRLIDEARDQGAKLSYRDLTLIMLTSKSTLKRDVKNNRSMDDKK